MRFVISSQPIIVFPYFADDALDRSTNFTY